MPPKAKSYKMLDPRKSSDSHHKRVFIVSNGVDKADLATRKLIRSHVMRGKKQKKNTGQETKMVQPSFPRVKVEEVTELYTPMVPSRVGGDFSFIQAADDIDPSTLFNIIKRS